MNRAQSILEPLMERLYDDREVLRPKGLTTRPHTDVYLSEDPILMCFGNTVKTKENQFLSFSRKIRPCWKKFLYHQLPNMMIYTHAKFAPLDFINKTKMNGKRRFSYSDRASPLSGKYLTSQPTYDNILSSIRRRTAVLKSLQPLLRNQQNLTYLLKTAQVLFSLCFREKGVKTLKIYEWHSSDTF